MKLPKELLEEFSLALEDAYPTPVDLDQMLSFGLGIHRLAITNNNGTRAIIYDLIVWFQGRDKTTDFLITARQFNPDNIKLFEIARKANLVLGLLENQQNGLTTSTIRNIRNLEREIKETSKYLDLGVWTKKLGMIEGTVCRIEYKNSKGNQVFGTGFLVGPNCLLTNYHIMEDVIQGNVEPKDLIFRFDYKILPDGYSINSGSIVRLAERDWLIDYSKYSPLDFEDVLEPQPKDDELDYALLLLDDSVRFHPTGNGFTPSVIERDWIKLTANIYDFGINPALFIVQHPEGNPIKLVLDNESVILTNGNRTRVRYRTNTEGGSSGSPCFNIDLDLVALHHSGDPNFEQFHKPTYNQGIPTSAIYELLSKRGKTNYLG